MSNIIKKINKSGIVLVAIIALLLPLAVKAQDTDDIKNEFISLGGTENGYKTILQVVEKSRASSNTLNNAIKEKYNQKLFNAMVAGTFDENYYTQVYNDMQEEKRQLVNKNLADMVNLLKTLSLEDRKAYAQLLYGIDRVISNSSQNKDSSSSENIERTTANNSASNTKNIYVNKTPNDDVTKRAADVANSIANNAKSAADVANSIANNAKSAADVADYVANN